MSRSQASDSQISGGQQVDRKVLVGSVANKPLQQSRRRAIV